MGCSLLHRVSSGALFLLSLLRQPRDHPSAGASASLRLPSPSALRILPRVLPTRVKRVCLFSGFLEIRFRRSKGRGVQLLRFTRVSISSSSFSSSSTVTSFFSSFSSLPTSSQHESICMGLRRTVLDANVLTTLRPAI